ncbi:hypothetical protein HYY73_06610 [Candidatus Woesearchaeota archaeon]|nr:hypothetical protein [Candidatus Woesearchaeota archaeon]
MDYTPEVYRLEVYRLAVTEIRVPFLHRVQIEGLTDVQKKALQNAQTGEYGSSSTVERVRAYLSPEKRGEVSSALGGSGGLATYLSLNGSAWQSFIDACKSAEWQRVELKRNQGRLILKNLSDYVNLSTSGQPYKGTNNDNHELMESVATAKSRYEQMIKALFPLDSKDEHIGQRFGQLAVKIRDYFTSVLEFYQPTEAELESFKEPIGGEPIIDIAELPFQLLPSTIDNASKDALPPGFEDLGDVVTKFMRDCNSIVSSMTPASRLPIGVFNIK